MPYILVFDTETDGLPKNYNADYRKDPDNFPRVVQIAWKLIRHHDGVGEVLEERLYYFNRSDLDGYEKKCENLPHGITMEQMELLGHEPKFVYVDFLLALDKADFLVAHNAAFDHPIVGADLSRYGMDYPERFKRLKSSNHYCTMQVGTVRKPGGRWPKLDWLFRNMTGKDMADHYQAHDALGDVGATAEIFSKMVEMGMIKLPETV